mgnify:FL=1|jgi:preprotein translocase subunit SecA
MVSPEFRDLERLATECPRLLALDLPIADWAAEEGIADQEILERITDASNRRMAEKAANFGPEIVRMAEKSLLLQILDQQWKEHLLSLDHLRQGINLRAYAQKDPLNEYKREAFVLFQGLLDNLRQVVTSVLSHLEIQLDMSPEELEAAERHDQEMHESRMDPALAGADGVGEAGLAGDAATASRPVASRRAAAAIDPEDPSTWGKVPRNAACPCGSGKKYKHCHGRFG